ncbi:MAG TPA: inosine/xanthosine triphosphatase [Verrucomicrobiae bacterium]|nr:inosine/xanthosine triphosphatase [Verrucomicrobiae bacterium]
MERLVVAVGSTRRPKLDAVRSALALLAPRFFEAAPFEVASLDVPSGVRHTPLSREESMAGARRRAEELARIARERNELWKYFVGLEGGLDIVRESGRRWVFLENWTYVADASGRGAFGRSGGILLPEPLVRRVVDEGVELAQAIDEFAQEKGIRDARGAWGVLSRDIITRADSFRLSVIGAFSAFFGSA